MADLKKFKKELFKSAQQPFAWLLSAERLRDAAEAILAHEFPKEVPYFRAHAEAEHQATAEAHSEGKEAVPPKSRQCRPTIRRHSCSMLTPSKTC